MSYPHVARIVGRFLYTGRLDEGEEDSLVELLVAADKYLVLELRQECQRRLAASLAASPALAVPKLCDVLRAAHLLASASLRQVSRGRGRGGGGY